jgi:hypothetical protein
VDDRAARAVSQFAPFDYLTDIEMQHGFSWVGEWHTKPTIRMPVSSVAIPAAQQARYTWVSRQERQTEAEVQAD